MGLIPRSLLRNCIIFQFRQLVFQSEARNTPLLAAEIAPNDKLALSQKSWKVYGIFEIINGPGEIRTHDPLLRRQVLYPS